MDMRYILEAKPARSTYALNMMRDNEYKGVKETTSWRHYVHSHRLLA